MRFPSALWMAPATAAMTDASGVSPKRQGFNFCPSCDIGCALRQKP